MHFARKIASFYSFLHFDSVNYKFKYFSIKYSIPLCTYIVRFNKKKIIAINLYINDKYISYHLN